MELTLLKIISFDSIFCFFSHFAYVNNLQNKITNIQIVALGKKIQFVQNFISHTKCI